MSHLIYQDFDKRIAIMESRMNEEVPPRFVQRRNECAEG